MMDGGIVVGGIVSGAASAATETFLDRIGREICYACNYQKNVEDFESEVKDLGLARERLEQEVNHAKSQTSKIHEDVKNWCNKVENFHETVVIPIEDGVQAEKPCFIGCPNLFKRYMLSRKAAKATKDCAKLLTDPGNNPTNVSYNVNPVGTELMPDKDYEHFDSRNTVFQNIKNALRDPKINIIGVCGMGGLGKSMLVTEVARQVRMENLFDRVVNAEVTHKSDWREVQEEIAYRLDLNIGQFPTAVERKNKLYQRLNEAERVLIILDDIWEKPPWDDIGIPFGNDEKGGAENQRRRTFLLTSRDRRLLVDFVKDENIFPIKFLTLDDAKALFWKTVDDKSREASPDFQLLALQIIGKCDGLPIAIKTVAETLKRSEFFTWKEAADWLNDYNPSNIERMDVNLSSIELSYRLLPWTDERSLFQLCGLQNDGSRIPIEVLLRHGVGLNLIENVGSLGAARRRVLTLISRLKGPCLLFDGDNEDHVKMHGITYAVAVSIAKGEKMFNMFNIQNVACLMEELEKTIDEDPMAISTYSGFISELPPKLKCLKLKFFQLFTKNPSLKIPDLFFEETPELQVLDLTGIHFTLLPSSLVCLTKLRTLSLENCQLTDVKHVGMLQRLKILSFRDSNIKKLPEEIGQLTRLNLLDLSNCRMLKEIEPDVLQNLSGLEELYMGNSFTAWEVKGGKNASPVELKQLSGLTTLDIHIPDPQVIPQDFVFLELDRYRIFVGDVWSWSGKYETSKTLKLKLSNSSISLKYGMQTLLKRTEALYLDDLAGFGNVVPELDDLPKLKHLHVQNGLEILYIVNSKEKVAFSLLESLVLHNLMTLEKIFHCEIQFTNDHEAFHNLSIINVEKCHLLKHLFSLSVAKNLLLLREIDVTDCKQLKMVVGKESSDSHDHQNGSMSGIINFPKLQSLTLRYLPELTTLVFDVETPAAAAASSSKQGIPVEGPKDLLTLFNEKVTVPLLEKLILSSVKIEKIWLDQSSAMSCGKTLTILILEECYGLKFLFASSMVLNSFVGLQRLEISHCQSMEGLVDTTGLGRHEERKIEMVFPKLVYLSLSNLPSLTRFGIGNSIQLPSLLELRIDCCPNLKSFISRLHEENIRTDKHALFDEKVKIPSVEKLRICLMHKLRKVWHHTLASDSFSQLNRLEIVECNGVSNIFPSTMRTKLQQFKHLTVIECNSVEEIIEGQEDPKDFFDQLISLRLEELHKIKNFEPGRESYAIDRTLKKQMSAKPLD